MGKIEIMSIDISSVRKWQMSVGKLQLLSTHFLTHDAAASLQGT